ncbi:MAG: OmpA family protein [bacterium]|nr:OmpA family protein [bacterium]
MKKSFIAFLGLLMMVCFTSTAFTQLGGMAVPDVPGLDPASIANKLLEPLAIEFPFNKYSLPGSELLDQVGAIAPKVKGALDKIPDEYRIYVVGHADSKGKKPYNKALSGARARKVFHALVKSGVPKKSLEYVGVWDTEGSKRAVTFKVGKKGSITQK